MLAIEYQIYISCGDADQIWMGFKESNRYFCKIKILPTDKLMNRALFTPPLVFFLYYLNTLKLRQNEWYLADGLFKGIFLNENHYIFIQILLKFVPRDLITNMQLVRALLMMI